MLALCEWLQANSIVEVLATWIESENSWLSIRLLTRDNYQYDVLIEPIAERKSYQVTS